MSVLPELQSTNEINNDDNPDESGVNGAPESTNEEAGTDNNCKEEIQEMTENKENVNEFLEQNDANTKDDTNISSDVNPNSRNENEDNKTDEAKENSISADLTQDVKSEDKIPSENNIIDEDADDYLLYLEDILRRIHAEFYATIEKEGRASLRDIIPRVRAQVLKGVHITFSGLIPTHQKLHQSRAYKVARAFGAEVSQVIH